MDVVRRLQYSGRCWSPSNPWPIDSSNEGERLFRFCIKSLPVSVVGATYTYAPAAQLITFDGYADANTHTQV
ncbi:hypothetical protein LSH36_1975g00015 [Paralvinella palmiformis]|uniref:Uncharacterized protein n=1 Tax=Paralvinella palmiformis TaxID=53620 RepID=A0AAD9IR81_9ANNE|nr:hypothetical protein LSH36_1975g00015 [Paralvinella palmiformis]